MQLTVIWFLLVVLPTCFSFANSLRREATYDYTFSYFIYPVAGEVPGLGKSAGLGATILNIGGTDLDFTGVKLGGDFDVEVLSLMNMHLLKERLVLDVGSFKYDVISTSFDRGQNSSKSNYILPAVKGSGYFGQLTLNFNERMIEIYSRINADENQVNAIYASDGSKFDNVDISKNKTTSIDYGILLDFTDHRYDPRLGVRAEVLLKTNNQSEQYTSKFNVVDTNLSLYIPVGDMNTWGFNFYSSDAIITKQASTEDSVLRPQLSLGCDQIPSSEVDLKNQCQSAEDKRVQERIALNRYGRATPLGGSQRLGSFENGRFTAGHSRFAGTEFRWNINKENTNFNYGLLKGVRTGYQLAFFSGVGTVADQKSDFHYALVSSGVGGRVVFKGGTVFRADWATGKEGQKWTIFVDYPWGLSSVDNSTR